uniref:MULE domain-containing protein n=1 Tax=Steinernema glaseri TaxID=37863 RepID=A0A1I7Z0Y5_9BILA
MQIHWVPSSALDNPAWIEHSRSWKGGAPCETLVGLAISVNTSVKSILCLGSVFNCQDEDCPRARGISVFGSEDITITQEHSCNVSVSDVERRRVLYDMKEQARTNEQTRTRNLVLDACGRLPDELAVRLQDKTLEAMSRTVQRQREVPGRKHVDAKELRNVAFSTVFSNLGPDSNQRFLLWDSRNDDPGQVVIFLFATDAGINRLRMFEDWSGDGQFGFAPTNFMQIYTIAAVAGTHVIPSVFALLPNKTEGTYIRIFRKLAQVLGTSAPLTFMSDYELAARNAVELCFPGVILKGCLFHLAQSIHRNVSQRGYLNFYNQPNSEFRVIIRCLSALSLLPENMVEEGFNSLFALIGGLPVQQSNAAYVMFDYFASNYISKVNGSQIEPATFPIATWNSHQSVVRNLPRTNNALEGFHSAFRSNFSSVHPCLSKVIVALQNEEKHSQTRLRARLLDPRAPILAYKRKPKYVDNDRHIRDLVQDFDAAAPAQRNLITHLRALQYRLGSD